MKYRNTSHFWDRRIKQQADIIIKSPIYLHKNYFILKHLLFKKGNLLNIGIGYGFIEKFIQILNKNLKLYGIDISKEAVNNAKSKLRGEFALSKSSKIPFKTSFDYILALDVLEHLDSKELTKTFKAINKILTQRGQIIISVPVNESNEDSFNNRHLKIFTPISLSRKLKKFGFSIKKTKFLTAFRKFYVLKNILNKIFKFRKPNLIIVIAKKK